MLSYYIIMRQMLGTYYIFPLLNAATKSKKIRRVLAIYSNVRQCIMMRTERQYFQFSVAAD